MMLLKKRSDVGSVNAVADRIADIERQKDSHTGSLMKQETAH